MSASPIMDNACRSCGEELAPSARFCPNCGTPVAEPVPLETAAGPVVRGRVEARWLGMPARFLLLCLGFAGLGAAIGLFATGNWGWGIVAFLVAAVLLAGLWEATRRAGEGDPWTERSSRLASGGRAHAATAAEVWRTKLDASVTRWRTRSRLDEIEIDREPVLQRLGEAVWGGDPDAEQEARQRLEELEEERRHAEEELAERLAGAEERIRRARLPVQDTQMVTSNEPNSAGSVAGEAADAWPEDRGPEGPSRPYPPPDEGNPPQPAEVPEAYPPPDEGTPPTPASDPGQTESE